MWLITKAELEKKLSSKGSHPRLGSFVSRPGEWTGCSPQEPSQAYSGIKDNRIWLTSHLRKVKGYPRNKHKPRTSLETKRKRKKFRVLQEIFTYETVATETHGVDGLFFTKHKSPEII